MKVPPLLALFLLLPITLFSQDHLLISEIVVSPSAGEFLEIYNPTGQTIDLSDYYITDATNAGSGLFYYNIVTGVNAGGSGTTDFHARFPDGATIAGGAYQTIAMQADLFATEYGELPSYELTPSDDAVADMREALPGSISGNRGLSNSGEVAILYFWDGASDLVSDVDYVVWGDKNEAVDKSGISIDGPDGDSSPSNYLNDTPIASQIPLSEGTPHADGNSVQRLSENEIGETGGGNGLTGNDETSEDLGAAFFEISPTPNAGPPASGAPQINSVSQTPVSPDADEPVTVTANVTDDIQLSSVTLFYSVDSGAETSLSMSDIGSDNFEAEIPGQAKNSEVSYYVEAIDSDEQSTLSTTRTYTVTGPADIVPISEIQENFGTYDGQIVAIQGIVTLGAGVTSDAWTSAYVQDESGRGINIFMPSVIDPSLVRGNEVLITGTVDEFNGVTELVDYTAEVISSANPLPEPLPLTTSDALNNISLEGTYVQVSGQITDIFDTGGDFNITVDDGSGAVVARIWGTTGIDVSIFTVGQDLQVSAVMGLFSDLGQLVPGYQDELSAPGIEPGDGSGVATIEPGAVNTSGQIDAVLTISGQEPFELESISVSIPGDWAWDGSVSLSGAGLSAATASVSGTIITISGAAVNSGASGIVTMQNLTAPDFNIESTFVVRTAVAGGTLTSISSQPSIIVGEGGTPTTDIADIQNNFSQYDGLQVTVQGIITLGAGITAPDWTSAYIQDASGRGINIFTFDMVDPDIVRGNEVLITGIVDEFNGVTEIVDFTSEVISTGNAPPQPLAISTLDATNNTSLEGTYVGISGDIVDVFAVGGGTNITVDDGSGEVVVRVWDSAGLDVSIFSIGQQLEASAVMGIFTDLGQLIPGYQDELFVPGFVPGDGSGVASISPGQIEPAQTSDVVITLTGEDPHTIAGVSLTFPGDWSWDGSLSLGGAGLSSASASVSGTTITISAAAITEAEAGSITLQGMTAPNVDVNAQFTIRTAAEGGTLTSISSQPLIVVGLGGEPLVTIEEIQTNFDQFNGQQVAIQGIVTLGAGVTTIDRTDAYIQDNSGYGINVFSFDPPDPNLVRGSSVKVTGTITDFGGITEITDYTLEVLSENNPVPEPLLVNTSGANDISREGTYVKVTGVVDAVETFADAANITISDDRGSVLSRVWGTTGINISFIDVGDTLTIIAIMDIFSGAAQLTPGYQDELEVAGSTSRSDGSGIATLDTSGVLSPGDTLSALTINLSGTLPVPIEGVQVDIPKLWGWTFDIDDVQVSGTGIAEAILRIQSAPFDSIAQIIVEGAAITPQDTVSITIRNLIVPDESLHAVFWTRTRGDGGRLSFIASMPRLIVGDSPRHLIYDLQQNSLLFTEQITIRGVTTVGAGLLREVSSSGDSLTTAYIQDESGRGVNLFQFGLIDHNLVRGNSVEVIGTVTEFGGITEIEYNTSTLLQTNSELPAAVQLTNEQVNHPRWDGTLIASEGVILEKFSAGGGSTLEIGDGKGTTSIRIWDTANLDLTDFVENSRILVEGVGGLFISNGDSVYQFLTVYQDQIMLDPTYNPSLDNVSLSIEPHPFAPDMGEMIDITYNAGAVNNRVVVRIFDLGGRLITTLLDGNAQLVENTISWDGRDRFRDFVPLGAYLCHLEAVEPESGEKQRRLAPIVVGTMLK